MALPSTSATISYAGNGTGPYHIPFKFFSNDHIELYADGVLVPTGYSITGAGSDAGGELTTVASYDPAVKLTINRVVPFDQPYLYREGDPLPAKTLEDNSDYLAMQTQQVKEVQDRSIKFKVGSGVVPEIPLTPNTTLVIDDQGNPSVKNASEMVEFIGVQDSVDAAAASAAEAEASAAEAAESANQAGLYENSTILYSRAAQTSASNAFFYSHDASVSAYNADVSAQAAAASAAAAGTSETNAAASATAAGTSETNAAASAQDASDSAAEAAASAATTKGQQVFADSTERLAAVPDYVGQLAIQLDTSDEYYGTATSAGAWEITKGDENKFDVAGVTVSTPAQIPLKFRKALVAYEVAVDAVNDMGERRGDLWKFIAAIGDIANDIWDVYDFRNDGNLNSGDTWKGLLGRDFSKHSTGTITRGANGITFPSDACLLFDDSADATAFETMAPNGVSAFVCCKSNSLASYVFGNGGTTGRGGGIAYYDDIYPHNYALKFSTQSETDVHDEVYVETTNVFDVIGLTYDGILGRKTLWRGCQIYGQSEDPTYGWGTTGGQPALGALVSEGGTISSPFTGGEVASLVVFNRELTPEEAIRVQQAQRKHLTNLPAQYAIFDGHDFVRGVNPTTGDWEYVGFLTWQRTLMYRWDDAASWHSLGKTGNRADYMLARGEQHKADRYRLSDLVDKLDVFLWVGTNDIFYGRTAAQCAADIKELITHYYNLGARVHLMLGTQRNDSNTAQDPALTNAEINSRIQEYGSLLQGDSDVVNMTEHIWYWYIFLTEASGYTDGLHLTASGEAFVEDTIKGVTLP